MSEAESAVTEGFAEQVTAQVLITVQEELDAKFSGLREEVQTALDTATQDTVNKVQDAGAGLTRNINKLLVKATEDGDAINTSRGAAEKSQGQIEGFATQSKTALDTITTHRDTVVSLGTRAAALNEEIESLQEQVRAAETSANKHQETWTEKFNKLFEEVEGLLPGATGAGLASGFRQEKQSYESKQKFASWAFGFCLFVLIITLASTPLHIIFGSAPPSASTGAIDFLERTLWNLPLVLPAVWGAWWFNRKAHTYDRLAEEYRQKEAISNAFLGYTKQLQDLGSTEALNNYLAYALKEVCIPAGRIYDKALPPGSPMEENLDRLVELAATNRKGNQTPSE